MKKKFDEVELDSAVEYAISNLIEISRENEYALSMPLEGERLKYEIINLLVLLYQFPKTKSYSIDEIESILETGKYNLLKSTKIVLVEVFNSLSKYNLLPGIYISAIGVLDLVSDLNAKPLSNSQVDSLACGGIGSIEKPSIFLNYIYQHNRCPFCKEPVKIENIVVFITETELKAGITFTPIKKSKNGSFHYQL